MNISKIIFLFALIIILFPSCLAINYDHITEKYREYEDLDFNKINTINIITEDISVFFAMKQYIMKQYRHKGLFTIPQIRMSKEINEGGQDHLNIYLEKFIVAETSGWREKPIPIDIIGDRTIVYYNNVEYWKSINVSYNISLFKPMAIENIIDLTGDAVFSINDEWAYERSYLTANYSSESIPFGVPSAEDIAKAGILEMDSQSLLNGVFDEIFNDFFSERLFLTSREIYRYKLGFSPSYFEANKLLRENNLEGALLIWESIFSDTDLPSYSRGVAAHNIAVFKTIHKEYDEANKYFILSDQLIEYGMYEINKF